MTNSLGEIESAARAGYDSLAITRRVFFLFPTHAFREASGRQFDLYQEVADFFGVPFNSIHIVGSAKTGHSLFRGTPFDPETSDVDIALIDSAAFLRYVELAFLKSNGWRSRASFPLKGGNSTYQDFQHYLRRGIFRPDLMPTCRERGDWLSFFGTLSTKYRDVCNGISASIYVSAIFFEWKQKTAVELFLANKGLTS